MKGKEDSVKKRSSSLSGCNNNQSLLERRGSAKKTDKSAVESGTGINSTKNRDKKQFFDNSRGPSNNLRL